VSEVRHNMLEVLDKFLPSLRALRCVERIGLTGSLKTPKREPKDIDVVVCTITGSSLSELATIYRKMSGGLQSIGRGVDVFIFENGYYVGRLCRYRDCAPGIRASCAADHCGLRPYLCDDLSVVELYSTTLTRLPVQLHPDGWYLDDVPQDVKDFVKRHTEIVQHPTDCPSGNKIR